MKSKPNLKAAKPLPCRVCGHQPRIRSSDIHFASSDDYLFTEIRIECSSPDCSKEHRHFGKYATRREAIKAWNKSNG